MRVFSVVFLDRIINYYEQRRDAEQVRDALSYYANMKCRVVEDSISEGPDHYKRRGPSAALVMLLIVLT